MRDLSVTEGRGTAFPSTTDGKETQNFYQESWQLPHSWTFCNNKISNMLPTFNKCCISEFPTPCPHPNMANILEKEAIIIFIFFFIFIIKGYKTGHCLPGNFLCLRIGLTIPPLIWGEVPSASHDTARSGTTSVAPGDSLTLGVTNPT